LATLADTKFKRLKTKNSWRMDFAKNYDLYILSLPTILFYIFFMYFPMYGVQIAFKEFIASKGIMGSPWVGVEHIERFFHSFQFWLLLGNTLKISLYSIIVSFPLPIILALMLMK